MPCPGPHDDSAVRRLPRLPDAELSPAHFSQCPPSLLEGLSAEQREEQIEIYKRALAEARAVAQPSLVERDLLGVWN